MIDMANQSRNAGAAAGDSLTGIEKIVGTAYGDEIHAGGGVVRIEAGAATTSYTATASPARSCRERRATTGS